MKQYKYRVNGKTYDVTIDEINGRNATVMVNGKPYDVEIDGEAGEGAVPVSGISAATEATPAVQKAEKPAESAPAPKTSAVPGKGTPVKAPLPGVVSDIKVKVGDTVKKGQTVVVLEAMKMQNNIGAECDGTVTSVTVNKGDSVMTDDTMLTIG